MKLTGRLAALLAVFCCLLASCAQAQTWTPPVQGAMDGRPRAQDDFFSYVNYDWAHSAVIREGRASVSAFSEVQDRNQAATIELLKTGTAESHDAQQAQAYFRLMTDMDSRNKAGTAPLLRDIERIEEIDSIEALSAYMTDTKDGSLLLLGIGAQQDLVDSTLYVTLVMEQPLSLRDSAEYAQRTETGMRAEAANRLVMRRMFAHMGRTEEEGEALYETVLGMEAKLAPFMYTAADQSSPDYFGRIYNLYTLEELAGLNTAYPLTDILQAYGFDKSPFYFVCNPGYHAAADALYTQENLEGLKAMLIFRLVSGMASILDQTSLDIANEADALMSGADGSTPLEEIAYGQVTSLLPGAVGRLYVENCFTEETRQDVLGMVETILALYRGRMEKAEWLSEATRRQAIAKIDAMTVRVGFGEQWGDYTALQIDENGSLYDAVKAYSAFTARKSAARVGTRVDPREWDMPTHLTNANYNLLDNSINIYAGMLCEPFYTPGGSVEENLGGIATVIGHELTHAFDANGSQFDADGGMKNWWTEADYAAFSGRSGRVADYYGAIEVLPGVQGNGVMMQGEAVADLGGVSVALQIAEGIEGFDYEVFFESYARIWREQCTMEMLQTQILMDPHPAAHLRCNATLQQFEEFHETYDVTEGDGMYLAPQERLSVW